MTDDHVEILKIESGNLLIKQENPFFFDLRRFFKASYVVYLFRIKVA